MRTAKQGLGAAGERLARAHLVRNGYEILETNVRLPGLGELDIVARDGGTLVLVEVRTRRGEEYGSPEESLTDAKRARLAALGQAWLERQQRIETPWRVDLVAVQLGLHGKLERVEIVKDVVEDMA